MVRNSLYVVMAVMCAAVAGCAATRGFADERAILEQPARVDASSPETSVQMVFSFGNNLTLDVYCKAILKGFPDYPVFENSFRINSGSYWSGELRFFNLLYCQFWIESLGWQIAFSPLWEGYYPANELRYEINETGVLDLHTATLVAGCFADSARQSVSLEVLILQDSLVSLQVLKGVFASANASFVLHDHVVLICELAFNESMRMNALVLKPLHEHVCKFASAVC
ncbi:hypothetical protein R1sor_015283 [Riccia sorocarpa]|uniref:Lipoprotein n=1 Tax=Riccia sorocarpa TaxID=122646 RepID=A0ABD3HFN9_9MARC